MSKWNKYHILLFCSLLPTLLCSKFDKAFSQEVLFSQFQETYAITNPAIISDSREINFDFNLRNYRVGNGDRATSYLFSVHYPFLKNVSAGISVLNDNNANFITTQGVMARVGYHLPLVREHNLSFSLQGGYFQNRIEIENIILGNQFVNEIFNPEIFPNENLNNLSNAQYFSISSGLFWFYQKDKDLFKRHYFGISLHNLNQPRVSFLEGQSSKIPLNMTVFGGFIAYQSHNKNLAITPSLRWVNRNQENMLNLGLSAHYIFGEIEMASPKTLQLGLWYDINKVIITKLDFIQPDYQISFSYDFTMANASQEVLNSGLFELSIKAKLKRNYKEPKIKDSLTHSQDTLQIYLAQEEMKQIRASLEKTNKNRLNTDIFRKEVLSIPEIKEKPQVLLRKRLKVLEEDIFLEEGYSELDNESLEIVQSVIDLLESYPNLMLEINTYVYEEVQNLDYSIEVLNLLEKSGIESDRIVSKSQTQSVQDMKIKVKLIVFEAD